MRDFFLHAERIYFDEAPCTDFDAGTMVDDGFLPVFKAESRISAGISDEQLFKNLKLLTSDNFFKNGTVLFFGKEPESIFDKALIRCIAFQGQDKRFITDDKFFGGNLYRQYIQAMQWLRGKLNVRYDIEGQGGGPRKEIWEIPETVFKEAIINALSHRDYYDKGALIHIEVFDDRVEISNPGGLVSAIPESEFGKRSHSRNPLIFGLFARMHLVEQVGSGVGRIQNLMKEAALPEALFLKEGIFTVILKRPSEKSSEKTSEKTSEKILELLKTNSSLTADEIAVSIGVSVRTVKRNLKQLQTDKKLRREGSDKSGLWIVLDDNS
jgi:ATP-dependent DNA helicase RecG